MLRQGGVEEGLEVRGPSYNPGMGTDGVKGKELRRAAEQGLFWGTWSLEYPLLRPPSYTEQSIQRAGQEWGLS